MRSLLAAVLLLAAGAAFADARADAIAAGALDCFTTGEAIAGASAHAFHELNPIGALEACALKIPAIAIADRLPEPDRTTALHAQRALWDGVGAHNLALIAGASSSAATGAGIVIAIVLWERGSEEREFFRLCAIHRQLAHDESLRCIYTPSKQ